jgi:hypothetical protein
MPDDRLTIFTRRQQPAPTGEVVEVVEEVVEAPPPPSPEQDALQERLALTRQREVELRDIGGLAVEMVRRDRWKPELLISRAGEVLSLEQRMHELDSVIAVESTSRSFPNVAQCKCGSPLPPGVHFCSQCGRPAATTPAVVTCVRCGRPLPAEANFCSACGTSATPPEPEPTAKTRAETMERPSHEDEPEARL